jgi:RHS repeat-associated protein
MLFDGEYGKNNSEYRTEIESYNKIYARESSGNGPKYFEVQMSNGSIMYYGKTDDSRVKMNNMTTPSSFMISEMKDAYSNFIKYNYAEHDGETYIESIEYTGNYTASMSCYNKIEFYYAERNDQNSFYFKGHENTSKLILREIKCFSFDRIYRKYKLTYYEKENKSVLYSIQEMVDDDNKYNPTYFNYGYDNYELAINSVEIGNPNPYYAQSYQHHFGDFDNDGHTDMLLSYYGKQSIGDLFNQKVYVYLYKGDHEGNITDGISYIGVVDSKKSDYYIVVDDFNNDGYSDYALFVRDGDSKETITSFNEDTASLFEENEGNEKAKIKITLKLFIRDILSDSIFRNTLNTSTDFIEIDDIRVGDLTANGVKDIVVIGEKEDGVIAAHAFFLKNINELVGYTEIDSCETKDITINLENLESKDRLNVLLSKKSKTDIYRYSIFENSNAISYSILKTTGYPTHWHKQFYGDFNGDGLRDVLTWNNLSGWYIGYNNDNFDFIHAPVSFMNQDVDLTSDDCKYQCLVYDINKDGLDDIMEIYQIGNIKQMFVKLHYSIGSGFIDKLYAYSGEFDKETKNIARSIIPAFIRGNSFENFLVPTTYNENMQEGRNYSLTFGSNDNNGLLTKIKNGIGNQTEIEYKSCLDYDVCFPISDNNDPFPVLTKRLPYLVTYKIKYEDSYITYKYKNLKIHIEGKGLLCFGEIRKKFSDNKREEIINYDIANERYYPVVVKNTSILAFRVPETLSEVDTRNKFKKNMLNQSNRYNFSIIQDTIISTDYVYDTKKVTNIVYNSMNVPEITITKNYSYITGSEVVQTATENITYTSAISGGFNIFPYIQTIEIKRGNNNSILNKQATTYNNKGRINSIIKEFGQIAQMITTTEYDYNSFGGIVSTTLSDENNLRNSSVEYDDKGRFAILHSTPMNYISTATYDHITGKILSSTDANELSTSYLYDSFGQIAKTTLPTGIATLVYSNWADKPNNMDFPIKPPNALFYKNEETDGFPIKYEFYDKNGNLIRTAIREPELVLQNKWIYSDIEYDVHNRVTKEYQPHHGVQNKFTEYKYVSDSAYFGKISKITFPDNTYIKYTYSGRITTSHYYVDNSLFSKTIETIDALGNLYTLEEIPGGLITYEYGSNGQVKSVINDADDMQSSIITFDYDVMGNRTKINDPDAGIIKTEYNVFGELIKTQTAEQADLQHTPEQYIRINYDDCGRVISKRAVTGSFSNNTGSEVNLISYLYSENKPTKGMLISETSETGKKEYSYDQYLRLSQVTESVLNSNTVEKSFSFGYEYDNCGRIFKEIYPHSAGETENSTLKYAYDNYGYLVKKHLGSDLIWQAKAYAEQGQLSSYTLGNNLTVTKTFDTQGRLTNITGKSSTGTSYQNMSYDYRPDGNMHYRTDALIGLKEWFQYDTQNRLISWETTALSSVEPDYTPQISYEGNRISQKENIGNYTYSGFPHHGVKSSGVTTITNNTLDIFYDHNTIDGRARVSSIISGNNSVTYTHGTSDELIKKTETKNGNTYTTYYAADGRYELQVNPLGIETKLSYLGSGIVKYDAPGTTDDKMLYLLKDHLGSIVRVLSINGNTINSVERFSYDVWGNRRDPIDWTSDNDFTPQYIFKGFTGHEHIEGFGLIHMKGRVYDPALGLFLSPDPYVQSATTMGFNRYSYCMGNPLRYYDLDGEYFLYVIPNIGWSKEGGLSVGVSVVVGIPGVISAQAGVGYSFKSSDFNAYVGATAAFNTIYASYSTVSGFNVGWSFGLSPYIGLPISTNFTSIGINYNFSHKNLSYNVSAWQRSINSTKWTFNPSFNIMICPEHTTNFVKSGKILNNSQMFDFMMNGDKYTCQEILDYFGFKGKYDGGKVSTNYQTEPGSYWGAVNRTTKNISYGNLAFESYETLYSAYYKEFFTYRNLMTGRDAKLPNELQGLGMDTYLEEVEGYMYTYRNQGLFRDTKIPWSGVDFYRTVLTDFNEIPSPTYPKSEFLKFIYRIPRLW